MRRPWRLSPYEEEDETRPLSPGRMGSSTFTDVSPWPLSPESNSSTVSVAAPHWLPPIGIIWGKAVLTRLLGMAPTAGPAVTPPSLRVDRRLLERLEEPTLSATYWSPTEMPCPAENLASLPETRCPARASAPTSRPLVGPDVGIVELAVPCLSDEGSISRPYIETESTVEELCSVKVHGQTN